MTAIRKTLWISYAFLTDFNTSVSECVFVRDKNSACVSVYVYVSMCEHAYNTEYALMSMCTHSISIKRDVCKNMCL